MVFAGSVVFAGAVKTLTELLVNDDGLVSVAITVLPGLPLESDRIRTRNSLDATELAITWTPTFERMYPSA